MITNLRMKLFQALVSTTLAAVHCSLLWQSSCPSCCGPDNMPGQSLPWGPLTALLVKHLGMAKFKYFCLSLQMFETVDLHACWMRTLLFLSISWTCLLYSMNPAASNYTTNNQPWTRDKRRCLSITIAYDAAQQIFIPSYSMIPAGQLPGSVVLGQLVPR